MIRRFWSYFGETVVNQLDRNIELQEKYYEVKNNRNKKFSQILEDILVIAFVLTIGLVFLFVVWIVNLYLQGYLLVFGRGDPE